MFPKAKVLPVFLTLKNSEMKENTEHDFDVALHDINTY
mgnify:CR=1 FL=1